MRIALVMALLLALPATLALDIEAYDLDENPINRTHFKISSPRLNTLIFALDNTVKIDVPEGPILLVGDNIKTLGADYIFQLANPDQQGKLYLLPAATVRGTVYNNDGFIVPNAQLSVKCGNIQYDAKTDKFGSYELAVVAGNCELYAIKGDYQGTGNVELSQGELLMNQQIVLTERVIGGSLIATIVVGVLVFLGLAYFVVRAYKPGKKSVPKEKSELSQRARDIIETLSEKETLIAQYLISHGEVYQNKLCHELHIPKTSLVRLLKSLEAKKVVEIEKIGKTKKIRLSSWFNTEKA